jgi:LysR family hydrogen peroxide-inducible transcriptional activator
MTINQIEYLTAVAKYKNFSKAAAECYISQPALSMQIKQLETELGGKIFDRSKSPIRLTPLGEKVLKQGEVVLNEFHKLNILRKENAVPEGEISLGVIPTLAPYLLPLFLKEYAQKFPKVKLNIRELTTSVIIEEIKNYRLDTALLATPLHQEELIEVPLFYEQMLAYVSPESSLYEKEYALASDIDPNELWLLEEGHCLRSQIIKLCELKKQSALTSNITFQAGSIETLIRLVDSYQGVTIIPELATINLDVSSMQKLRSFFQPVPTREISLVYHRFSIKNTILKSLENCIREQLPHDLSEEKRFVLDVD